jgi:hypothetical protein
MSKADHWNSQVLTSVMPVVSAAQHVRVHDDRISAVARWMAYEEFAPPIGDQLFHIGEDPQVLMDHTMLVNTLNFAFTDFHTGQKFEVDYQGRTWSDSEAMLACIHQALGRGVNLLDGQWMASVTRQSLEGIFAGSIEMPMLDERVQCLNEVGGTLMRKYGGRWHNFIQDCSPMLYDNGEGVLERLVSEFPRFGDVSDYQGHEVHIYKLAQLGLWGLHLQLAHSGSWGLKDAHMLTAFADYIVPVALRVMDVFEYSPELEQRITNLEQVPRDSQEEIEIRAASLYAVAVLTDEVNLRRPGMPALLIPQVDYRLWKSYHATHWPHHLTTTIMY